MQLTQRFVQNDAHGSREIDTADFPPGIGMPMCAAALGDCCNGVSLVNLLSNLNRVMTCSRVISGMYFLALATISVTSVSAKVL